MSFSFIPFRRNKKTIIRIEDMADHTRRGLRQGMFRAGNALISEADREIQTGTKTGIIYIRRIRGGRRRRHQSSAAGQTHANLSGALRRSLSFQLRGSTEVEFGYGVSSGRGAPDHAKWVEFGTSRMKARPSLRNAIRVQSGNLTQFFGNGIEGEI